MKSIYRIFALTVVILAVAFAVGCGPVELTSDQKVQQQQEQMTQNAVSKVGMPGIELFTEKRLVKKLYELRDQKITTYTYLTDMNGRLFHLCDSIGYGLPYSVQYSNPEQNNWLQSNSGSWVNTNLPQAEPNGLFMPSQADGTWVFCITNKKTGEADPVYVEPHVISSPVKLHSSGEYQESAN